MADLSNNRTPIASSHPVDTQPQESVSNLSRPSSAPILDDVAREKIGASIKKSGIDINKTLGASVRDRSIVDSGEPSAAFDVAAMIPQEQLPHYDKYEGSASDDFVNGVFNAGVIRTGEGLSMLIPSVAKQAGAGEWADTWIDNTIKWADRNEKYISHMGNKSFFETFDVRSLSAGLGQGVGSMIPMLAAAAGVAATGGVAGVAGAAGLGLRAGAAAASATYGTAAGITASSINILPTIVEEGLENGLNHQQSTALALTIAPIIGLLEKAGMDAAVKAGLKPAAGAIDRKLLGVSLKEMLGTSGVGAKTFEGTMKVGLGKIAKNLDGKLAEAGIFKRLGKEVAIRGKDYGVRIAQGSLAEASTESIQSLVETAGKQIYDLQFSDKGSTVGRGKFGADVMSKEAWMQAMEEGFYGGLIGGSFAGVSRFSSGLRTETVTGALDAAKRRGTLDQEVDKMNDVINGLSNTDEDKTELRNIVRSAAEMVRTTDLSDINDANSRHQIFSLGHMARTIREDIEQSSIKGVLPEELQDLNDLKILEKKERLAEIRRAIVDINSSKKVINMDDYGIMQSVEDVETKKFTKALNEVETKEDLDKLVKEYPFRFSQAETIQRNISGKAGETISSIPERFEAMISKKKDSLRGIVAEEKVTKEESLKNQGVSLEEDEAHDKAADEKLAAEKEDGKDAKILEAQERLGINPEHVDGYIDIPPSVKRALARVEEGTPTDINAVKDASEYLYDVYKRLEAAKESGIRTLTVEQIDNMLEEVGAQITTLENFINDKYNEQEQDIYQLRKKDEVSKPTEERKGKDRKPKPDTEGKGQSEGSAKVESNDRRTRPGEVVEEPGVGVQATKKSVDAVIEEKNKAVEQFQKSLEELYDTPATPMRDREIEEYQENIFKELKEIRRLEKIKEDAKSILEPKETKTPYVPKSDLDTAIEQAEEALADEKKSEFSTEESIAAEQKNLDALIKQKEEAVAPEEDIRGNKRLDRALKELDEAKTIEEKAAAINKFDHNARLMAKVPLEKRQRIEDEKAALKKEGYEMPLKVGDEVVAGQIIDIDKRIEDSTIEKGKLVIDTIVKPDITKDGKQIQAAKVDVRIGTREQTAEEKKKQAELDKREKEAEDKLEAEIKEKETADEEGIPAKEVLGDKELSKEEKKKIDDLIDEDPSGLFKTKKSRVGLTEPVVSDRNMWNKMLDEMKKLYPNIPVHVFDGLVDEDGMTVLGYVNDKYIGINDATATQDTLFHEFAHKLLPILKGSEEKIRSRFGLKSRKTSLYQEGLDLIKNTRYYDTASDAYPGVSEEEILDEALTLLVGEVSVDLMKNKLSNDVLVKVVDWLQRFWSEIKRLLGQADVNDIARIAAMEIVYRTTPTQEQGIVIGGKKYHKMTPPALKNLRRLRNAGILANIQARQNLSLVNRSNIKMLEQVYDSTLRKLYRMDNPKASSASIDSYIDRNKESLKPFRDTLRIIAREAHEEIESKGIEFSQKELLQQIDESQNAEEIAEEEVERNWIGESERIDANVRAILDNLLDERGDPISPDAVYGIATKVARGTKNVKQFLDSLKDLALQKNRSLDTAIASKLHDLLRELPPNITYPVIESLRNLVTIDYIGVRLAQDGLFIDRSNEKHKSRHIGSLIMDSIRSRIQMGTSDPKGIGRKRSITGATMLKDIATAKQMAKDAKGIDVTSKILSNIEAKLASLTGIPFKVDWFVSRRALGVSQRATVTEKRAEMLKGDLDAIEKFLEFATLVATTSAKTPHLDKIRSKLDVVSKNITESVRDAAIFPNIMGNQQRAHRIGGFAHRYFDSFTDKKWVNKFKAHPMFKTSYGKDMANMYIQSFRRQIKDNQAIIAHTDGMENTIDGVHKKIQHNRMHEKDQLIYQLALFTGNIDVEEFGGEKHLVYPETYYQSTGTLGSREFKALANVPVIDSETAKKTLNSYVKNGGYNQALIGEFVPTSAQVDADVEWIMSGLDSLSDDMKKRLFGNFAWNDKAIIKRMVESFVYNDAIHRIHLGQMLEGDFNKFGSSQDIIKRLAGTTSPIQRVDTKKKLKVVVLDDFYLNKDGEIYQGKRRSKEDTSVSDSQSFFNDFLVDRVRDTGGALIDYGNSFKPVVNQTSADGKFVYIKTASLGFKGRENIEGQDKMKEAVRKFLKKFEHDPVMVVFESGIKSNKGDAGKTYKVEDLDLLEPADVKFGYDLEPGGFGVQFNINDDLGKKGKTTPLSSQLVKIAGFAPEHAVRLEKALSKVTNLLMVEANEYMENREKVITDAASVSKHGNEGVGNTILDYLVKNPEIITEKNGKIDHYDVFSKVQNYIASVFTKTIRYRLSGGKGLQSVVYDDSLKWMKPNPETGRIEPAEVKVPDDFAEEGAKIILSRIPNSDFMTNIVAVVKGHTGRGNVFEVHPEYIKTSNSDLDGDGLFAIKEDKKAKTDIDKAKNEVYKVLWDLMTDATIWDRYQNDLEINPLLDDINSTSKEMGFKSRSYPPGTIRGSLEVDASLKESNALIGSFAVGSKVMDVMSQSEANLVKKFEAFDMKGKEFSNEQKPYNSRLLQLALDDTKYLKMGDTGITLDNVGVVNLLLGLNVDGKKIMSFIKHPAIVRLTKKLKERRIVYTQDKPQSERQIIAAEIKELKTREIKEGIKVNEKGRSSLRMLEKYQEAHELSRPMRNVNRIVQLDKRVPKDIIALYHTLGTFDRLRDPDVNRSLDMGSFFDRPLVQLHEDITNNLKKVFDKYFSFSISDEAVSTQFNKLIYSFTSTKAAKDVSYHIKKTQTQLVAQRMSLTSFKNQEEISDWLDFISLEIEKTKQRGLTEGTQWFSLVRYDNYKKRIIPSSELGIPELNRGEDMDVNRKFINEAFYKLDTDTQNMLIEYAIYESGLMGTKYSIANLLPESVYDRFFNELQNFSVDETFFDEVAISGVNDIQNYDNDTRYGTKTARPGDDIKFKKGKVPSVKYFTLTSDEGLHLYKVDVQSGAESTAKNIWTSSKDIEKAISAGDVVSSPFFPSAAVGKPPSSGIFSIPSSVEEAVTINEDNSKTDRIIQRMSQDLDEEFPPHIDGSFPSEEQFQKKTAKDDTESTRGLRRTLRRLRNTFGVNYDIINDPEQKFAGAYNPDTKKIVINEAYAKGSTPFHEFAHPFISAIKKSNPELYSNLVTELNSTEEGKAILKGVAENYSELNKSQQTEEAIVELLGREAAGEVKTESLKEIVISLLKEIAAYLKRMFGNRAAVIPSQIDPKTTLNQLSKMLVSDESVELDKDNDTRVKRILASGKLEAKNLINKAYKIANYAKLLSPKNRSIRNRFKEGGFLLNDTMIITKDENLVDTIYSPVAVRVPTGMDNWFNKVKKLYPEAKIISKEYSGMKTYKRFSVYLGEGDLVTIYKPIDDNAGSMSDAFKMNIKWDKNISGDPLFKGTVNKNKTVMDGHDFPMEDYGGEQVSAKEGRSLAIQRYEAAIKGKNLSEEEKLKKAKDIISDIKNKLDNIVERKNVGNVAGVVSFTFNQDQLSEIAGFLAHGTKEEDMDGKEKVLFKNFNRAYTMIDWLSRTNDSFLNQDEDGKIYETSSDKVSDNILDTIEETSKKRETFLDKHPIFKTLWNRLVKGAGIFRWYWLGSMTPKVFSNIIGGKKQGFLRSILYDSFWKGEQRQWKFNSMMHDIITNIFQEGEKEGTAGRGLGRVSRRMGAKDHELDMIKVTLDGKPRNIPVARAIALYMTLRQPDVQDKYMRSQYDNEGKRVGSSFVVSFGDIDMGESKQAVQGNEEYTISLKDFKELEKTVNNDKGLLKMVTGLDNMYKTSATMLNPTMKGHVGIGLDLAENYYPTQLASAPGIKKISKKQLEDFRYFKAREKSSNAVLRIEDAFENADLYIREASNYYGYAEPVMNLRKLISRLKSKTQTSDNNKEHKMQIDYMEDLLEKIQDYSYLSGVTDTKLGRGVQKFMNNFQLAVLGLNPSVAVKQPVSMTAAAVELGRVIFSSKYRGVAASVMKGVLNISLVGKNKKAGQLDFSNKWLQRVMKVSPIMEQRFKGFIDREQGEFRSEAMNPYSKEGKKTKLFGHELDLSKTMEWIKIMDAATICAIFARVEDEIRETTTMKEGAAFDAAVKERFEQVVNDTQPTYSILNRTQFGRAKDPFLRIFTMFSSQRAKNANIMIDAMNEFMTDPSYENKMKFRAAVIGVGVISSLSIAVIDKIKYMLYGNFEDKEKTAMEEIASMAMTTFMGNFYGGGQVYSGVFEDKPWDAVSHPVLQMANDALDAGKYMTHGDFMKGVDKGIMTYSKATGLPTYPYARIRDLIKE